MLGYRTLTLLIALAVAVGSTKVGPAQDETEHSRPPINYAIVVTGNELLEGKYSDKHVFFLTNTLRPYGLRCDRVVIVPDRIDQIQAALQFTVPQYPLVIVTGGLGPTPDDVTRDAIAKFTGIPLREEKQLVELAAKRFGVRPENLRENVRRQCHVPSKGTFFPNRFGTAAGLVFETGSSVIVALPGPPRELHTMSNEQLLPYLVKRFGIHAPGTVLKVRFVGIGESQIDAILKQHVRIPSGVVITSLFEAGRVDYYFWVPGDPQHNRRLLQQLQEQIQQHLSPYIYAVGHTSLEQCVFAQLAERDQQLAVIEIGTGGSLAAALTTASNQRLAGCLVASSLNQVANLLGITGDHAAREKLLLERACTTFQADWVVYTGPVVETNGRLQVPLLIRAPSGKLYQAEIGLRSRQNEDRAYAVTSILNHLRQLLAQQTRN